MNTTSFLEKKGFLDKIYYDWGKQQYDFFLQYSEKDGINTKWRKYSEVCFDFETTKNHWFIKHCNQRQILLNEIVLDLEEKDSLPKIIKVLKKQKKKFYVYETGSRGYHIHIFSKTSLSEEKKLSIIKLFGADEQKCYDKTLIAMENSPHWKSGKIKKRIEVDGD